jgi:hypothetical protein
VIVEKKVPAYSRWYAMWKISLLCCYFLFTFSLLVVAEVCFENIHISWHFSSLAWSFFTWDLTCIFLVFLL